MSNPYVTNRGYVADPDRCDCCKRPWAICVAPDPRWRPPKGQHTCKVCWEHAGAAGFKLDKDHIELWRALLNDRVNKLGREINQLKAQLVEARQALDERPEKEVVQYIGQDETRKAQEEARRAFASRQHAWQVLSEIQCTHRERKNGQCQCGRRFEKCEEAQMIAEYPALVNWVRGELERLRNGLYCDLPENHPAQFYPKWQP